MQINLNLSKIIYILQLFLKAKISGHILSHLEFYILDFHLNFL